jgi:hypothetical protein
MAQNLRQQIAEKVVEFIKTLDDPRGVLVTREPFDGSEIAITQFPAVLITAQREERETITMGHPTVGRRQGTIIYSVRGFVRGNDLDRKRNDLLEAIEEVLDQDRYLELRDQGVTDSQVTLIEIVDRQPPLAEFVLEYRVTYNYLRTAT